MMEISQQKKLIKRFYLIALVVNIVLPLILSFVIVGGEKGEIKLLYIAALVWAVLNALIYCLYFVIPEFKQKWEKIAGLLFPSLIIFLLVLFQYINFYLLLFTLIVNLGFILVWIKKFSK